ncbi:hypothetical protein NHX12_015936 [Muraenolepis orangiensis]|uniref:SH3 domain-containing YSC84-like protein 1 n=1 Tax=Muraenolepis orangiensis TaxID=630683 RepID=A0A9Q0D9N1_9TELE|nr:hypothetical protein NHX12_015936 [Muraenolepis orangiensis]
MGRNVEADVVLRSTAAVFTYCLSRGLFAGISLEGFYSQDIRASAILNGAVEPPAACHDLYHILEAYTEAYTSEWTSKHMGTKSAGPARPKAPSNRPTWNSSAPGPRAGTSSPAAPLVVTATHPFSGQQPGDLSIVPGDRITVVTRTGSQFDWWEGRAEDGRLGLFPANFVSWS